MTEVHGSNLQSVRATGLALLSRGATTAGHNHMTQRACGSARFEAHSCCLHAYFIYNTHDHEA